MLTKDKVLEYCKLNLGFPYKAPEHGDDTIFSYINMHTVPLFSSYVPDIARMSFKKGDEVPGSENLFLLNDAEDCDVLVVKDVIYSIGESFITNHPWTYFPTYEDMPNHYMDIFRSRTQGMLSLTKHTYEFQPPNKLWVVPARFISDFIVKYERTHPTDYSTIPAQFISIFLDLCLADVKDLTASIREQYQTISTPWGEIVLNPEALRADADKIRDKAIEKLGTVPPSLILDIG